MTHLVTRRWFCIHSAGLAIVPVVGAALLAEEKPVAHASRQLLLSADRAEAKPPVITTLRLHPAGTILAAAGDDHFVRLYQLETGKQMAKLAGHHDWVRALDFAAKGEELLTAGNDGRVLLWSLAESTEFKTADPKPIELHRGKPALAALRCAHHHPWLGVVGRESTVRMFDLSTRKQIREITGPSNDLRAIAFSVDDSLLAVAGSAGKITIWNAGTGEVVAELAPHRRMIHALAFSPDGKFLASAGDDRQIHIHPVSSESQGYYLPATAGKIRVLLFFSPHQLASGGSDNLIHIWDVHERRQSESWPGHTGTITALENGPASMISASYDAKLRIWSAGDRVAKDTRELSNDPPREETLR